MTYGRALKILGNRAKYTPAEIREAYKAYNKVHIINKCPLCGAIRWVRSNKPCGQCLTHYSVKLDKYYDQ